jgi:murein DD-endopeptidase MepM/ murein hydrolase activator NlpD
MEQPLRVMDIRRDVPSYWKAIRVRSNGTRFQHQGWDLLAAPGTPAYSIAYGVVTWSKVDEKYGLQLLIQFRFYTGETLYAFYAHLDAIRVHKGERVKPGEIVALTGDSGNAAGLSADAKHLHFELRTRPDQWGLFGLTGRDDPARVLGFDYFNIPPYASVIPDLGNDDESQ